METSIINSSHEDFLADKRPMGKALLDCRRDEGRSSADKEGIRKSCDPGFGTIPEAAGESRKMPQPQETEGKFRGSLCSGSY